MFLEDSGPLVRGAAELVRVGLELGFSQIVFFDSGLAGKGLAARAMRYWALATRSVVVTDLPERAARLLAFDIGGAIDVMRLEDLESGRTGYAERIFVYNMLRTGEEGDRRLRLIQQSFPKVALVIIETSSEIAGWLPYIPGDVPLSFDPHWIMENSEKSAYQVGVLYGRHTARS